MASTSMSQSGWASADRVMRTDVARTRSRVIDGALTLLGLARIEPELDRAFRVAGVRRQLENHLGFGH